MTLDIFGGKKAVFKPNEPLKLDKWFAEADEAARARREAEAAKAARKGSVEKGNKDVLFRYHVALVDEPEDFGDEAELSDRDFVIGVRPEFIRISDDGALEGEVYSAMPTGMETTVRIRLGNYLLTGVVFGGVLYRLGQKVRLDFDGQNAVLYARKNGKLIAQGSLTVE